MYVLLACEPANVLFVLTGPSAYCVFQGKVEGDDKDPDEVLLLGDFDEEEDDDEDRSWRR